MAALPQLRRPSSGSSASKSSRLPQPEPSTQTALPKGPCNFRDISIDHAPNCGCRHFWRVESDSHPPLASSTSSHWASGAAWCFCGHHACYHDHDDASSSAFDQDAPREKLLAASQINLPRPTPARYPMQPHVPSPARSEISNRIANAFANDRTGSARTRLNTPNPPAAGLGLSMGLIQQASVGPEFPTQQEGAMQGASQLPSTRCPSAAPTEVASDRGDLGRRGESAASFFRSVRPGQEYISPLDIPTSQPVWHKSELPNSATEIATPSIAGTPALPAAEAAMQQIKVGVEDMHQDLLKFHDPRPQTSMRMESHPQTQQSQLRSSQARDQTSEQLTASAARADQVPSARLSSLISQVASLRNRVDAFEATSFSHGSLDDLSDKVELFDGRLLEVESRLDELEKLCSEDVASDNDGKSQQAIRSRKFDATHLNGAQLELQRCRDSYSTFQGTTGDRLQSIKNRLGGLEMLNGPTPVHPLEVEVVLLPFGHNLNVLWIGANEASQLSAFSTQSSSHPSKSNSPSRAQNMTAAAVSLPPDDHMQEWKQRNDDWLLPRACGPTNGGGGKTSKAYTRLKSRGFVRTVQFHERDARHVHAVICSAFDDVLPLVGQSAHASVHQAESLSAQDSATPLGLQSPFVPLRKIHKSSRLRFLSTAELATSSLWTVPFLESSVFMKAPNKGLTRLFITAPSAYLQEPHNAGWTWQKLRELPRVTPEDLKGQQTRATSSFSSHGVEEADAREPCWEFDHRLDPPVSVHSSFASNDSFQKQHNGSFSSAHPLSPRQTLPDSESDADDASTSVVSEVGSEPTGHSSRGHYDVQATAAPLAPITPMSEFRPSLGQSPGPRRTASAPLVESLNASANHMVFSERYCKRQSASFHALEHYSPPQPSKPAAAKRRRLSRTPDAAISADSLRAPWTLTPRRSREPGSSRGSAENIAGFSRAHAYEEKTNRGAQAYATPYSWSGAGAAEDAEMNMSGEEEDIEQDPEFEGQEDEEDPEVERRIVMDEEAWEGVGDGNSAGRESEDDDSEEDQSMGECSDEEEGDEDESDGISD